MFWIVDKEQYIDMYYLFISEEEFLLSFPSAHKYKAYVAQYTFNVTVMAFIHES